ncbi:MAG: Gfo/Idh/MocA family oxidoreductase [Butyricimonas faecihominis]
MNFVKWYLPRTEGVSSTQIRNESQQIVQLGVVGSGRIANRFIPEAGFVNGISITAVYNPMREEALQFCERFSVTNYDSYEGFLGAIDAVYIASPHSRIMNI